MLIFRKKVLIGIILFIAIMIVPVFFLHAQLLQKLPDNPLDGRVLFEKKQCFRCHTLSGIVGEGVRDLNREEIGKSFSSLAARIWNHFPNMDIEFKKKGIKWPEFNEKELVELTAFLYFIPYLGDIGDLNNGKVLFISKKCIECHQVGGKGGAIGPRLDRLRKHISPLYLAVSMWNHMPQMDKIWNERGIKKPVLTGKDINDLATYIKEASRETTTERMYLSPGNPNTGEGLFSEKGCIVCHPVRGKGNGKNNSIESMDLKISVTRIASLMWRYHSVDIIQAKGVKWPVLSGQEMADLLSYIYFVRFQDLPGNALAGQEIFNTKRCIYCHSIRSKGGSVGPDLAEATYENLSAMAAALLSHAPFMKDIITKEDIDWPYFTSEELGDVFAYLKSMQKTKDK